MKKLGLIVNPVAGIGGRVGLKGSDGIEIQRRALGLGAMPQAGIRTATTLQRIERACPDTHLLAWSGEMGTVSSRDCGLKTDVIGFPGSRPTGSQDTIAAAGQMADLGVDLILFSGGDGTARDILNAVGPDYPVLGIPAGVKMHSAVYGINPARAGDLAAAFLNHAVKSVRRCEVMDLDEETLRGGLVQVRLYGYLSVPYERRYLQGRKSPTPPAEKTAQVAIARGVIEMMDDDRYYIIGPGTTTQALLQKLGLDGSLIGVDMVHQKKLVQKDVNESDLLDLIGNRKNKIIVTLIGGQGFLFGRGNQQISPKVLQRVGLENIIVAATAEKIQSLHGRPLLLDTGDPETDKMLTGYVSVITGYTDRIIYRTTS